MGFKIPKFMRHNPKVRKGLHPPTKAVRVAAYVTNMTKAVDIDFAAAVQIGMGTVWVDFYSQNS